MALSGIFRAISEPIRLRILMLLLRGRLCVCEIEDALNEPEPKVSRHLSYLKASGLISSERSGRWVYYQIREDLDSKILGFITELGKIFENEDWALEDVRRLMEVKAKRLCE